MSLLTRLSIMSTLAFFCILPSLKGDVLHVPDDYPTIQAAISASHNRDVVMVGPGTYFENINFLGKGITLTSEEGAETTVIDGNGSGSVVTFDQGENYTSVLESFTIRNGTGTETTIGSMGGGIYINNASPLVRYNTIVENKAKRGGGIACYGSSNDAQIMNCIISDNTAYYISNGGYGGGIYLHDSNAHVLECHVFDNTSGFVGGGISSFNDSFPLLKGNVIHSNTAKSEGGGISSSSSSYPTVEDNIVNSNKARDGGGISCRRAIIRNNTIIHNTACMDVGGDLVGYGGGMVIGGGPETLVEKNYIAFNKAYINGGGILSLCVGSTFSSNIICYNEASGGSSIPGYAPAGGGIFFDWQTEPLPPVKMVNCLIHNNEAERGGGGIFIHHYNAVNMINCTIACNRSAAGQEIYMKEVVDLTVVNSIIYNKGGNVFRYEYPEPSITYSYLRQPQGGTGNIHGDPMFVDPANGDFHIKYTSPCRDKGDGFAAGLPLVDFEGDSRTASELADIGADEFHPHLYCTGAFSPNGPAEGKIVGLPHSSTMGLFIGSNVVDPPIPTAWGDFYLGSPWMAVPLAPIPSDGVLVIRDRIPALPAAPYEIPMQALIHDGLSNLFVLDVK